MIKIDTPITCGDVKDIIDLIGIDKFAMRFGLGVTGPVKYSEIFSPNNADMEIDITRAIMVRYLNDHPDMWPIPKIPTMRDVFNLLNKYISITEQEFANLLGRHGASGARWLKTWSRSDTGSSPAIKSLLMFIKHIVEVTPKSKRADAINELIATMKVEAKARGFNIAHLESNNEFVGKKKK